MNDIIIKNLTMDSRQVKPGDLFIAVQGLTVDGRDYIEQAIAKGAVAVLSEYKNVTSKDKEKPIPKSYTNYRTSPIPIIVIPELRKLTGYIAARFFSEPSKQLPVIGITGTTGKTSVSHFIGQIMSYCNRSCGIIGTLGAGIFSSNDGFQSLKYELEKVETHHKSTHDYTTPDAIAVQKTLFALKKQGASAVAMEVTSHALDQDRVSGIVFDTVIFTNLSRDHLDYHLDMHTYGNVKTKLFTEFDSKYSVINVEDAFGQNLFKRLTLLKSERKVIGYTTYPTNEPHIISTTKLVFDEQGIHAQVNTPWGKGALHCGLLGRFNLSNLLAALAAVCIQGVPFEQALQAIQEIKTVPGRMMRFGFHHKTPLVIVDYAHKPDALAQVLEALAMHCVGQLWCVVGCGGDRDRGKRPLMAAIGERFSDHLYLTQDNPRMEDPKQIMAEMIEGLKDPTKVVIEYDRQKAIESVIAKAKPEDIILIAGKGHETYQIMGTKKIPFSDQLVVETALERRMT